VKPSHQTVLYVLVFLAGVYLAPKVKQLPLLNKIPSAG
jgi:hypothetical protein